MNTEEIFQQVMNENCKDPLHRFAELVRQQEREAHRSGGLTVDITDLIQRAKAEERQECTEHYLAIMRDAVEQAVKREREACAKLCEQYQFDYAAAIRGRTE
jgi:predicted ATP-dependent protease